MNDLVYVMYNLKLKNKQIRKNWCSPIWWHWVWWIGEERGNVKVEQEQVEDDGGNVDLARASLNDPTLDALDLDNIVFYDNFDEQFSSGEELDGDGDQDLGDDLIRGLDEETYKLDNICVVLVIKLLTYHFEN